MYMTLAADDAVDEPVCVVVEELGARAASRVIGELVRMIGRVVVGRAIGERRPIHDLGWRSSGVSEVFDAHAAKLLRLAR